MKRTNLLVFFGVLSMLFLFSIACKQSGEIITPAEATQRYEATQSADPGEIVVVAEGAAFLPGDQVELTSAGHLVGIYKEAGDPNAFSYATRGDEVMIVGSMDIEGVFWYKIDSTAGNGWLPETNIETE